jgi:hypothetical protein
MTGILWVSLLALCQAGLWMKRNAEGAEEDAEKSGKRFFTAKEDKFLRTRTKDVLDLPRRREGR